MLGVDEFAFRKGWRYGTVLVEIEAARVVDGLPDRDAATFATWLREHPGAEIICRDRASAYSSAVRQAAPSAQEIADRWHLQPLQVHRERVPGHPDLHRRRSDQPRPLLRGPREWQHHPGPDGTPYDATVEGALHCQQQQAPHAVAHATAGAGTADRPVQGIPRNARR
ncbi:transposase [Streptomyces phaeochromogenes]|uniref:transposase n=1 Tax=Streptomyces phaeochromogenes TaxID=1923 RepID=UPI0036805FB4